MRADAGEAVRTFAAAGLAFAGAFLMRGVAQILSGELDGGDAFFEEAIGIEAGGGPEVLAYLRCERCLVAIRRSQWDRAEAFAGQARAVLSRPGWRTPSSVRYRRAWPCTGETCISTNTAKSHIKNICHKLTAAHRGEAVQRARQLQLI